MSANDQRCQAMVWNHSGLWDHRVQCKNKGKIEEEGKLWCSTRAPSLVKARRDKRYQAYTDKLKRQNAAHIKARAIQSAKDSVILAARELLREPSTSNMTAVMAAVEYLNGAEAQAQKARTEGWL